MLCVMLTRYRQVIITNYLTGQDCGQYAPPRQRTDGRHLDHSHHDPHPHLLPSLRQIRVVSGALC